MPPIRWPADFSVAARLTSAARGNPQGSLHDYVDASEQAAENAEREPPSNTGMKATIAIECTPAEARAFFGLPDLQPIQAAVMERLQERMVSESDRFSLQALVN